MDGNLIGCDWGTSNLRLSLMHGTTGDILDHLANDAGVSKVYDRWRENTDQDRETFFLNHLDSVILEFDRPEANLAKTPIIISGMASSSIGIVELPYSETPCSLDGEGLFVHTIASSSAAHSVRLISGLRHNDDVLRGEETQIIGLAQLNQFDVSNALIILPGTHSKHVTTRDNKIEGFTTFMTGELFEVIKENSVLKESVQRPSLPISSDQQTAFRDGVTLAQTSRLSNSLFKVRTSQLFGKYDPGQNYYFLSGLLIGTEFKEIEDPGSIVFCGGKSINHLYRMAIDVLGLSDSSFFLEEHQAETLASVSHLALFNRLSRS